MNLDTVDEDGNVELVASGYEWICRCGHFNRITGLYAPLTCGKRDKYGADNDPGGCGATFEMGNVNDFNRYIALMNGANQHLGPYVLLIKALVDQASLRVGWLMTVTLLGIRDEKEKSLALVGELTEALIECLKSGVAFQWQEFRAVELVTDEVTQEFAGEDPMIPQLRSVFDRAKAGLTDIAETLKRFGIEVELKEPDDEVVDRRRSLVERELADRRVML